MITEELAQEIGDTEFPVEVFEKQADTGHEDVGKRAEVSPRAREALKDMRGKVGEVVGVYEKSGQVAGYRVEIEGKEYVGPKADFYVGNRGFVEDVYLDTDRAQHVKRVTDHFSTQHDYVGSSWHGVELFCFQLAKATDKTAIESAGWYEYESSTSPDKDGKDWRYVVPDQGEYDVAVNCHSVLHDDVWTLNTTTHSTTEISNPDFVGHDHHWARALLWTLRTAQALETPEYDYSRPIAKYKKRLRQTVVAQRRGVDAIREAAEIYERKTGNKANTRVDFGVSRIFVPAGKIAEHRSPTDEVPHSVVTIHPEAFERGMAEVVAKHEAIHAVINDRGKRSHGELFQAIGREMGIADKYLD